MTADPPDPTATDRVAIVVGPGRPGQLMTVLSLESSGAVAPRLTPSGIWLVGAAAAPIGGDHLVVQVEVRDGARLTVRSTGATVARPDLGGRPSITSQAIRVGADAVLCWLPEPGIAAQGARHVNRCAVELGPTSRLAWFDAVVLGRVDEGPGSWISRLDVTRTGRPLVASELSLGPVSPLWRSGAVLAAARCVISLVLVGPELSPAGRPGDCVVEPAVTHPAPRAPAYGTLLPLAGPGVQLTAWGESHMACRTVVQELVDGMVPLPWLPDLDGYAADRGIDRQPG